MVGWNRSLTHPLEMAIGRTAIWKDCNMGAMDAAATAISARMPWECCRDAIMVLLLQCCYYYCCCHCRLGAKQGQDVYLAEQMLPSLLHRHWCNPTLNRDLATLLLFYYRSACAIAELFIACYWLLWILSLLHLCVLRSLDGFGSACCCCCLPLSLLTLLHITPVGPITILAK